MQVCKLFSQGNSVCVTIPATYRRALGWKMGDLVYLEFTESRELIVRSLREHLETRKKSSIRGAGEITGVNKHLRLPRD